MNNLMEKASNNVYHNEEKNKDENFYDGYFSKAFEENNYLKKEIMKYKMQEVQYNKTILAQQKKLDFYSCNSHVHPDNDEKIDISILSQNAFKAIQKSSFEIEKDQLIAKYNNEIKGYKLKIKELLNSLREAQMKSRNDQSERRRINNGNLNNYNQKINEESRILKKTDFKDKIQQISKNINDLKNQMEFIKNKLIGRDCYNFTDIKNALISFCEKRYNDLYNSLLKEREERKKLLNTLQELRGNIRVYCRIRPLLEEEKESIIEEATEETLKLYNKIEDKTKFFEFDKVLNKQSQETFFEEIKPYINSFIDGYNISIFAYGQTGSGKTYTMVGPSYDPGLYIRSIDEIFKLISQNSQLQSYHLQISLIEIYNETINDLLSPQIKKLELKQNERGSYLPELTLLPLSSSSSAHSILSSSLRLRATSPTLLNPSSSRSHLILTLHLGVGVVIGCKFNLIDLAGSERLSRSGVSGDIQKESININRSLSALGDVIEARRRGGFVPFRNSCLTHLLQGEMSGDAKNLMIVQVNPSLNSFEESVCSLNFAMRVRAVEVGKAKKPVVKKKN